MKVRWVEEPPAARRGRPADTRTDDEKFADELRKQPGRWALYGDDLNSSVAFQIKTGRRKAFRPAGAFDATARDTTAPNGRGSVYIRYVGEEGE